MNTMEADPDGWDVPLDDAEHVFVVLSTPMTVATRVDASAAATVIASRDGGRWTWRATPRLVLQVNRRVVMDGQPVEDGDRLSAMHVSGQLVEATFTRPQENSGSALLALNRPQRDDGERAIQNWRDGPWPALTKLRERGRWLVFPGPGGRTRALAKDGPLGGCRFVVASAACARTNDIVDARASGACVVRAAGVCNLAEILKMTVVQSARLDVDLAIGVVRRLVACEAMPGTISVHADGDMTVHSVGRVSLSSQDLCRVLCWLLGARTANADVLEQHAFDDRDVRQGVRRLITLADSATADSYRAELAAIPVRRTTAAELGAVVRGLFPERIAQERELEEQLSTLDLDAIAALAR